MERFGNIVQWGERLKESSAQMGRVVSEKMKDMIQTLTLESKMVDEATLEIMEEPNWGLNLRICAMINQEEIQGTEVVSAMKKKISDVGSPVSQNLALDLLEVCTMNCEKVFSEVASERVLDEMVRMIDNNQTDPSNRNKALQMISAWGQSESLDYLPVFRQTYMNLKRRDGRHPEGSSFPGRYSMESYILQEQSSYPGSEGYPVPEMEIQGHVPLYSEGKKEILVEARNIVDLFSSMINAETGQISDEEQELHAEMLERRKKSQTIIQRIIETTTGDECFLSEALSLNDELQQIISKFSQIEVFIKNPENTNTASAASVSDSESGSNTTDARGQKQPQTRHDGIPKGISDG